MYDEDTGLLVIAGKGDGTIRWWEFQNDSGKYLSWPGNKIRCLLGRGGTVRVADAFLAVCDCDCGRVK